MPCPVTHTRAKGDMQKAEFRLPKDVDESKPNLIRW